MYYFGCVALGYLFGCVSPSYILGRCKKVDLKNSGTKNLGASNTFMHFGTFWGMFVMLFDIFKAYIAVKICSFLFREVNYAPLVSGCACVLGHNYPFYLKGKGGKGLASFGGMVLGLDPLLFLLLLTLCLVIAFVVNYSCTVALTASVLFPVLLGISEQSLIAFAIATICSINVFFKHTENIRRIRSGKEEKFRTFIKKYVFKAKEG